MYGTCEEEEDWFSFKFAADCELLKYGAAIEDGEKSLFICYIGD